MSEEEFHELERLNPDRKYEYVAGLAYMMSGSRVGYDRIVYNVRASLDFPLRTSRYTVFGPDVQVLLGTKKMVESTLSTQMQPFLATRQIIALIIR